MLIKLHERETRPFDLDSRHANIYNGECGPTIFVSILDFSRLKNIYRERKRENIYVLNEVSCFSFSPMGFKQIFKINFS